MNAPRAPYRPSLWLAVALLVSAVNPLTGDAYSAGLAAHPSAAVAVLAPQAALAAPNTWPAAMQRGPALPSSVLPSGAPQCSVETPAAVDAACSIFGSGNDAACSAHCNSGARCSAFEFGGGSGLAGCSVFGVDLGLCSVVPPAAVPGAPAQCSAFGGDRVSCSVAAPVQRKQACSAANPGPADDFCSAIHIAFTGPSNPECSVLGGGPARRHFCSTGYPGGSKRCSALGEPNPNGGPATCSIRVGQNGTCTALKQAPAGSCSVQQSPGDCSVIGGPGGSPVCRQP